MADLLLAGQTNDEILDSLSYRLAPTSEYIQQRRMSRFYPSGATSYSSDTTQVARIELKGAGGFLDMSTMKIAFRLVNTDAAQPLILAGGVYSLISRIRVFCQGSLVEDVSHYSRVHHLVTELLAPSNWRVMNSVESNLGHYNPDSIDDPSIVQNIEPGHFATVLFTPSALGVANCKKLWPIELAPLSVEITFAPPGDAVISHPSMNILNADSSTSYVINNLHLQCSQVIVDSALRNSFMSLLSSGRSLTLAIQTIFTQSHVHAANSNSAQISMVRALSKLGIVFISYTDNYSPRTNHEVVGFPNPSLFAVANVNSNYAHVEQTMETQLQLDSFLFPETRMDSTGEHFSKLQEAAATYDQKLATLSITPQMYRQNGFVAGLNLCRAPGSAFSGLNTRTGSLLVLKVDNIRTSVTKIFAHLAGTVLIEVKADSCSVYD
jgi:hypothetical protein